jgi:5'-nucleotidase (lipoprotein e(P4) family)
MMLAMSRQMLALILSMLLAGCAARQSPPSQPPPAPTNTPSTASLPSAPPVARDPDSIRWVRDSAEYFAALEQVYRTATEQVERQAKGRAAGAWGVVLDADETVISNATYQLERARQGLGYSSESWNAWVKRREATALPGAGRFLTRVRALGGRVAIVTNRLESECDDTAAVFKTHALVYDAMLCRPDKGPSDKNPRFAVIAEGRSAASSTPLEIVAFVGDNILDFPKLSQQIRQQGAAGFADFGVRYFLVPNPMYGSWH